MPIDKIAFKGVETSIQSQQEVKKEETQKQLEPVDKEKIQCCKIYDWSNGFGCSNRAWNCGTKRTSWRRRAKIAGRC